MHYLIEVYIELLLYSFPALITYLITNDIRITLLILGLIIMLRFLIAFYYINESNKKLSTSIRYFKCFRPDR